MKEDKYLELLKKGELEKLKDLLENTIRDNIAIKSNTRTRINAIKRMQKTNDKMGNNSIKNCSIYNDYYVFTDSYTLAVLKNNLGYKINKDFRNCKDIIDNAINKKEKLYIDMETLQYYIKIKEYYKNEYLIDSYGRQVRFSPTILKNAIDIMGKNCEIFTNDNKTMLIFINKDNEILLCMGSVVY